MYKRIGTILCVICVSVTAAVLCCVRTKLAKKIRTMQTSTVIVLACLIAVVVANVHHEQYQTPEVEAVHESIYETPVHDRSPRTKRGLFLLKKKLLLGALGLKAAKVGAVGAGVVGALALKKSKGSPRPSPTYVEIHSW